MGTWAEIRDGMKTRLATISGLSNYDVMPKTLPDKDSAVVLYGDPLVSPSAHGSKVNVNLKVVVRCMRGDLKDAQDAIDAYLWSVGTNSIVAAVYAGRTLGGAVDDTQWLSTGSVGMLDDGAVQAEINFLCKVTA